MFADLKGLHDLEEAGKAYDNRNKATSLAEKIQIARQEYTRLGTVKLNAAKSKAEALIIKSVSKGEFIIHTAATLFDLENAERKTFESWLTENGVICKRISDQRDGDYYTWEIRS